MSVIKAANNKRWNGANPHGYDTIEIYKKACPREVFLLYERAKGAHRNLVEGAPWFIGAIVLGNSMGMAASTFSILTYACTLQQLLKAGNRLHELFGWRPSSHTGVVYRFLHQDQEAEIRLHTVSALGRRDGIRARFVRENGEESCICLVREIRPTCQVAKSHVA